MSGTVLFELNRWMGVVFTLSLGSLFALMVLLWPRTHLHRMALFFMGAIFLATLRWCAATFWPDPFSAKESALAAVCFGISTLAAVGFAVASWREHLRDMDN